MKTLLIALGSVTLLMFGGLYYSFFYPPTLMKKQTAQLLQEFSQIVESQDRAKIIEALARLLADDAKVELEVSFSAIHSANVQPMAQAFEKAAFLTFMDHVLYTLSDYHFYPKLNAFALADAAADVQFSATQAATGPSYYSGTVVSMRFSGDTQCTGRVLFGAQNPVMHTIQCKVFLRSVASGDSAGAMIDKAQEIQSLMQQQNVQPQQP